MGTLDTLDTFDTFDTFDTLHGNTRRKSCMDRIWYCMRTNQSRMNTIGIRKHFSRLRMR